MPSSSCYCSSADWRALKKPAKKSRKGDNGKLLIIAGNEKYHGSAILAILAAVRFCDLVYFHSTIENQALARKFLFKIKSASPCVICGKPNELSSHICAADAILIGPGIGRSAKAKRLVAACLAQRKPTVLDADALHLTSPSHLHSTCLLTPHEGEFKALFGKAGTEKNVRAMAKRHNCTILKKGVPDIICSSTFCKLNNTHNSGMTKGGTGDVLAGLAAALLAAGNSQFTSACAAAYLNGYAGNLLFMRLRHNYSAEDLALQLSSAAAKLSAD